MNGLTNGINGQHQRTSSIPASTQNYGYAIVETANDNVLLEGTKSIHYVFHDERAAHEFLSIYVESTPTLQNHMLVNEAEPD